MVLSLFLNLDWILLVKWINIKIHRVPVSISTRIKCKLQFKKFSQPESTENDRVEIETKPKQNKAK